MNTHERYSITHVLDCHVYEYGHCNHDHIHDHEDFAAVKMNMPSALEPIPFLLPEEVVSAEHQEHEQQQQQHQQHQHQTLCRIADDWDVQDATAAAATTVSPDAASSTISEYNRKKKHRLLLPLWNQKMMKMNQMNPHQILCQMKS